MENPHSKWRNFIDSVSVSEENQKTIPFYYQQLFLGKHKAPAATLRYRAKETAKFDKAYKYFKQGTSGAVLLTGEPNSGTSYLIENIINTYAFENVLQIPSPIFLYADATKTIERSFHLATGTSDTIETIMKNLKRGTVLVFEDLEQH